MFIKALTPDCPICGVSSDIMVDFDMYKAWCNKEILVQDAEPTPKELDVKNPVAVLFTKSIKSFSFFSFEQCAQKVVRKSVVYEAWIYIYILG